MDGDSVSTVSGLALTSGFQASLPQLCSRTRPSPECRPRHPPTHSPPPPHTGPGSAALPEHRQWDAHKSSGKKINQRQSQYPSVCPSYLSVADDVEAMPAAVGDGGFRRELQGQRSWSVVYTQSWNPVPQLWVGGWDFQSIFLLTVKTDSLTLGTISGDENTQRSRMTQSSSQRLRSVNEGASHEQKNNWTWPKRDITWPKAHIQMMEPNEDGEMWVLAVKLRMDPIKWKLL